MKKTNSSDNVNTSVNINTDILIEESGQREGNKKLSDYVMTKEKINWWLQDETFQFWDTIDGKAYLKSQQVVEQGKSKIHHNCLRKILRILLRKSYQQFKIILILAF